MILEVKMNFVMKMSISCEAVVKRINFTPLIVRKKSENKKVSTPMAL